MSNMAKQVDLNDGEYISINAVSTYPIGTRLSLQKQGINSIKIIFADAQPALDEAGVLVEDTAQVVTIELGSKEAWAKSTADYSSLVVWER